MLGFTVWLIAMIYSIPLYLHMTKKLENLDPKKYNTAEWCTFGIMIVFWPLTFVAYVHWVIGFTGVKDAIKDLRS